MIGTERDPWALIHEILHPGSGAPAVEVTLHSAKGELDLVGAGTRVGFVRNYPAANEAPYVVPT